MKSLFEYTDKLNKPYECFFLDMKKEWLPVQPHWHYFMEILYVTRGTALMYQNEQSYIVNEGDLIVFLPSVVHSVHAVSDAPLQYYVLKFDLSQLDSSASLTGGSWNYSALFNNAINNEQADIYFPEEILHSLPVQSLFDDCVREMQNMQYGYQMILQSKVKELLTWLLRIWRDDGFDTDCYFSSLTKENTIYTITEYIDRHACENIRVEDIAALCHMSYSHFAKNFREIYGQSCKKYIEFIRLCKVEDMLLFTNFDLNYISQETGYADCSHLIRSFKEKYGVSPHQYRRQHSSPGIFRALRPWGYAGRAKARAADTLTLRSSDIKRRIAYEKEDPDASGGCVPPERRTQRMRRQQHSRDAGEQSGRQHHCGPEHQHGS